MLGALREQLKALPVHQRQQVITNISKLPDREKVELIQLLSEIDKRTKRDAAQGGFLDFIKAVYPGYKIGNHHRRLANLLEEAVKGDKKRIIVNIAPRHGKSEMASYLFPAWFLGQYPDKKIIMATHTADLSVSFGRRVRDLVDSPDYREIFPSVKLNQDAKAAGQWNTSVGGQYYAVGVGGALAGRGADVFVIDDPHNEQQAKTNNPTAFLPAWDWFQSGPLQRLMPNGIIIVVMTRWSMLDLTGQLVNHMIKNPDADQWEVVEFPAILNENEETERSLWPEFWSLEALKSKRAGMDVRYWSAQYMQNPSSEGAQLLKREWWRHWEYENPPDCEYIIMSLDAAQEAHNRADYSAVTTWGVFYQENPDTGKPTANIILLNAWKARMEFPELKAKMIAEYKEWKPDCFIVEKKSAGAQIVQEFRAMGIPVEDFTPGKGDNKIARVHAVSDILSSGMVWAPTDRQWAQEVITECAQFPVGSHDDMVDSTSLALRRFRTGGFITLPSDYEDEEPQFRSQRHEGYY
jgi:predicted phage terminase large subunit-like protein